MLVFYIRLLIRCFNFKKIRINETSKAQAVGREFQHKGHFGSSVLLRFEDSEVRSVGLIDLRENHEWID